MKRFIAALFAGLSLIIVIVAIGAALIVWKYGRDLPDVAQLATYEPPVTSRVYAGDGRLMAEYAAEKRIFVPIGSIPPRVINAFLAAEDKNFYEHGGIDAQGVLRAILINLENLGSGRRLVGASTIPQQVAKNFLLSDEVTLERKVKEAVLAFRMDRALSKDRILELYLNEIYLGGGSYGVAAASLNYFDKSLDELTLEEAAVLAALPKAPNNYDPLRHPEVAKNRRDWVIGRMLEDGDITAEDAATARAAPVATRRRQAAKLVVADYFAEEVRRDLIHRYGEKALYEGGLTVHASVDPRLQALAEQALRHGLQDYDRRQGWRGPIARLADSTTHGQPPADWPERLAAVPLPPGLGDWQLAVLLQVSRSGAKIGFADGRTGQISAEDMRWLRTDRTPAPGDVIPVEVIGGSGDSYVPRQVPKVEGALVALDPHTGRVLAMVGGWDYQLSQFNRVTQALRQPGSTFKPVVYLSALEAGYTPSSIIVDAPVTYSFGHGLPDWKPMNYSHRFYGPTTLRVGLERSRNVTTVLLADQVGMDRVADCARRLGIDDHMPPQLAYALGAGETTLLRLTTAYAMFVNGGRRIEPSVIDLVQDRYGRIIYRHDDRPCPECLASAWESQPVPVLPDVREPVTDPDSAYQLVSMLQGAVQRGTGNRAQTDDGRPIAGKTGTSNDAKDVWFVGFSPDLVAGVFLGYDEPDSLGDHAAGGTLAAPIFSEFMSHALANTPAIPFRTPPGVRLVRVDAATGLPAGSGNPRLILEAFKPGTAPSPPGDSGASGTARSSAPDVGTGGLY